MVQRFLILACAAALVAGCGSTSTSSNSSESQSSSSGDKSSGGSRCHRFPKSRVRDLASGLQHGATPMPATARYVRSDDYKRVYFVAVKLRIPGAGTEVGTWATNRVGGDAGFFAVDGIAKEFSDWGDGGTTDANITINDDGADESKECAEHA